MKLSAREALHKFQPNVRRREAGKAREEAARLQGMVQAMTSQNAELMRAVAGVTGTAPPAGPEKKKGQ